MHESKEHDRFEKVSIIRSADNLLSSNTLVWQP